MRCSSKRPHEAHKFPSSDGLATRYCEGVTAEPDPVADVTSGRGIGRLFEQKEARDAEGR